VLRRDEAVLTHSRFRAKRPTIGTRFRLRLWDKSSKYCDD